MSELQLYRPTASASPAVLTLAHVIMSSARRAQQAGRTLTPAGHLGLVAAEGLRSAHLQEADLHAAAATELQLRYGALIPRLTVLGATDYAIAIAFDARTLARPKGDPVDVLAPWRCDLPQTALQKAITAMLALEDYQVWVAQNIIADLRTYATSLPHFTGWPDLQTRILFERVVAGNMTLILRLCGAQEARL